MQDRVARMRVVFSGRVQGVFFRANTKRFADDLNVNGWVRNTDSGDVEALFEGDESSVKRVIERCRNEQPYAQVDSVIVNEEKPKGEFRDFRISH
jgi:acylphosphatase